MIRLSNGNGFEYVAASGSLGFDGKGWFWEKILVFLGLIHPERFVVVLRTLTLKPLLYPDSNLSWWRIWTWWPWSQRSCIRFLPNSGVVNKVGLYNPGFDWWMEEVAHRIDFLAQRIVVSIYGTETELIQMTRRLNRLKHLVAIEINVSCPNTGHPNEETRAIVRAVRAVCDESDHPIIVKLSVGQDLLGIATSLSGFAEAFSLNSVPWRKVFPNPLQISPVAHIGKPGDGGVSGRPAQSLNWEAVELLGKYRFPVIGPSVMRFEDLAKLRELGAKAFSFGAIWIRTPWKPTRIVKRDCSEKRAFNYNTTVH